jgi:hypothetical protein
MAIRP